MLNPKDPNTAALLSLAKTVDRLNGQVAALLAYVSQTCGPVPAKQVLGLQGLAQSLCGPSLAPPNAGGAPGFHASHGVEKIQSMAKSREAIESAGSPSQST